ncbi:unnamed protein product [Diatraea saccharalis]|uniref:C2H2-type domain-containing protein n=1 Tax=Diatraea saccharalis TaxID=40085 RepID=A0A9N9R5R4_9NEOP|nr:unnamed protein product [Diatraea saccharalis]
MTKKLLIRVLSYLRDNDKNNKENVDEEEVTLKEECLNMAENLVVCRGCLATNTKLYELHENNLKDLFREVVGSPVEYINESADEKPFVKLVFFEESPKDGIELDDVCNEYIVETEDVVTSETDLITTTKLDEPDKVDKPPKNSWCIYCGESFLNDVGLRNHKRKAHFDLPTTQFSCDSCDISFLNAEALQLHVDNICFNSANCCVHCGDSFESEMYLKFHILQMHRKVNRNMMKCDTCYAEFDTTKALSTHLSLTNGDCRGLSSCLQCGESFMTTSLMKKHVADSHLNVYDCQKCEESFPTIYTYGKHFEAAHMVDKNRRPSRLTGPKKWGVVSVAGARVIAGGDAATADTVAVCEYCGQICTVSV